ncbi:MAG: 16S rRNA (guanine(527)-N(7))-methyltransferase RsmG [Bacteroidales bacterium]|nr:16S rRNA (guanine(527)-N(7))-methyltransferase RsmG [Bacteroidales bacterium]
MKQILKYFPDLTETQIEQFSQLKKLYSFWNEQINVVSRKDIDAIYEHHVLHSLAIAKVIRFKKGTSILDVGTGGGFPGIPLAILFPETNFFLIDSTGKKIKVVKEITEKLNLNNVNSEQIRVEKIKKKYDFIVSRAVTKFPQFLALVKKNIHGNDKNPLPNGILYLKGGDFTEEIKTFKKSVSIYNISDFFEEEFFETKKILYWEYNS